MKQLKVKISGLNLMKIIDYLIKQHLLINNLIIKEKYIIFTIDIKDKEKLDSICKRENKRYIVLNKSIIYRICFKIVSLFGSVFALILCFIYMFSYSSIIFNIKVFNDTNLNYDNDKVYSVLSKNGVNLGNSKGKINRQGIRNILLENLTDISDCLVDYQGSNLLIKIYPEIKKDKVSNENLYSNYDAVVSEINIFSGKSDIKVGDVVKKGDLIVSSDDGSDARVKGKVYFYATKLYNQKQEKKVFSGNYLNYKNILIRNKKLNKTKNMATFSKYLTKKCVFYLTNNYIFPIKIESIYLFEYDVVEEYILFESVEEKIKKDLLEEARKEIPLDAVIIDYTYSVVADGDLVRIDCFIETIVDLV